MQIKKGYKDSRKELPNITFGIVDDPNFQAYATKDKDGYYIVLHSGLYVIIKYFFDRIFARNDFFTNVGAPQKEDNRVALDNKYIDHAGYKYDASRFKITTEPRDPIRRNEASNMANAVVKFILDHEIAHILNGHVDYLNDAYAMKSICEFKSLEEKADFEVAVCEMDADCTAISKFCHKFLVRMKSLQDSNDTNFEKEFYEGVYYISFVINSICWILGGSEHDPLHEQRDHPHGHLRGWGIHATFLAILDKRQIKYDLKRLMDIKQNAFLEAYRAYILVTSLKPDFQVMEDEQGKVGAQMFGLRLTDYWTGILRRKILPFAYIDLAP